MSQSSGLAGIACWINSHYRLKGDKCIDKKDPRIVQIKGRIDAEYEDGRVTVMSDGELEAFVSEYFPEIAGRKA